MPPASVAKPRSPTQYTPEFLAQVRGVHAARLDLCRRDINSFTEYVLKDEITGESVKQAPIHLRIQYLAGKHKRLGLLAMPGCGKSQAMIARILWCLGNNPKGRYAIVAQSATKAKAILQTIKKYIESSDELHQVFPSLRPGEPWTDSRLVVQREGFIKDPSVVAYGVNGDITGTRVDGLVIDDILTEKNTRTKAMREKMYTFVFRTLWDRVEKPDGWIVFMGNAWHPDDLLHRLERGTHNTDAKRDESEMSWHVERIRVLTPDGQSTWPERFPMHVIEGMRDEFGPLEFARKYLCEARSDEDARFKRVYIDSACKLGERLQTITELAHLHLPRDWGIDAFDLREAIEERLTYGTWSLPLTLVFGVDLASSESDTADETVLFGALANRITGQRLLLQVTGGHTDFDGTCKRIIHAHNSFRPDLILVESNGAQLYIKQHLTKAPEGLNLRAFYTGKNKWDSTMGVEALSGALAMGRWVFPVPAGTMEGAAYDNDVAKLIEEALYFTPNKAKHTGDRLMAWWLAEMGLRSLMSGGASVKAISLNPERTALDKARAVAIARGETPIDWAAEERLERERADRVRTYTSLNSRAF